jgi:exosortase
MSESGQTLAIEGPHAAPTERETSTAWWMGAVILTLLAALYWPVLGRLVRQWWSDSNWSHGFVVPLFSAFLLWRRRNELAAVPLRPLWAGLGVVCAGLALLVVGTIGAELFLSRCSLILVIGGLVILFLGWGHFRAVLFPWLFLFLMIPIPAIVFNQITFPLQLLASQLASWILAAIGIPVLREGNVIQLAAMPLEVAEACSGIRSLLSLFTLALIYGYFTENESWKRALLAFISLPIAVAANAARIVGTGLMVQYGDPDKAVGFFHEFSGWVIFLISVGLLCAVRSLINLATKRASQGRQVGRETGIGSLSS